MAITCAYQLEALRCSAFYYAMQWNSKWEKDETCWTRFKESKIKHKEKKNLQHSTFDLINSVKLWLCHDGRSLFDSNNNKRFFFLFFFVFFSRFHSSSVSLGENDSLWNFDFLGSLQYVRINVWHHLIKQLNTSSWWQN